MTPITTKDLQAIWKHSDGGEYMAISKALIEKGLVTTEGRDKFWNFSFKFHIPATKLEALHRICRHLHENHLFEMSIERCSGGNDPELYILALFQHQEFLSQLGSCRAYLDIHDVALKTTAQLLKYSREELDKATLYQTYEEKKGRYYPEIAEALKLCGREIRHFAEHYQATYHVLGITEFAYLNFKLDKIGKICFQVKAIEATGYPITGVPHEINIDMEVVRRLLEGGKAHKAGSVYEIVNQPTPQK